MADILVVDDSKMQAKALAAMLKRLGHNTFIANDGETAAEVALNELPDLILMDVVMPGMNGFQATRQIAKHPTTEHIPIILISGKSQETDKYWGLRQGAKGYLVKPFDETDLENTVNEFLPN